MSVSEMLGWYASDDELAAMRASAHYLERAADNTRHATSANIGYAPSSNVSGFLDLLAKQLRAVIAACEKDRTLNGPLG